MSIDVANFYPEGVAIDAASNTLFVGSFGTGAVHRASLTDGLARELVAPFGLGGALAGLKVAEGALWACVNPADVSSEASRLVKVDPDTGEALATYTLALYTFCNDLVRAPSGRRQLRLQRHRDGA